MFKLFTVIYLTYCMLFSIDLSSTNQTIIIDDCVYPPVPTNWQYHVYYVENNDKNAYDPFDIEVKKPGFLNGEVKRKDLEKVIFYFTSSAESYIVDIFSKARKENKYIIISEENFLTNPYIVDNKEKAKNVVSLGNKINVGNWIELNPKNVKINKQILGSFFLEYNIWNIISKIKIKKELAEQIVNVVNDAIKNKKQILINTDYLRNYLKQKWLSVEYFIKVAN